MPFMQAASEDTPAEHSQAAKEIMHVQLERSDVGLVTSIKILGL